MTVWILLLHWHYDCSEVVGVYTSQEAAEEARPCDSGSYNYTVENHEVVGA